MQLKELINEYGQHLRQARGVSRSTRHQYIYYVQHFLSETFADIFPDRLRHLQPSELIQYVIKQKEHHHEPVLKSMLTALRSFLKFLQMKGLCEARLVNAVPSLAAWKLSRIPSYLTKEQLGKFLASFDRKAPTGRLDYAIALCLARLGLRAKEVAHLTLDDIDWRSGTLRITSSKSRRFSSLPLPKDVGKAIVSYLRNGRPLTEERHLFVCHRLHTGQPLQRDVIRNIIRRRFKHTGMQVQEYLKFKRSCGYQLEAPGKELMLFARYAMRTGHNGPLTTDLVVSWAKLPQHADPCYWANRYNMVRRFAEYRFLFDPETEIPQKGLLGPSKKGLSPHIYSQAEITAFLQAASQLAPTDGLHPRTYVTFFGLLVSTGLRISEALTLSRQDADLRTGVLTIRETKFRKSRLVAVHPSTLQALKHYSKLRDSYHPGTRSKTFFLSEKVTPLNYRGVLYIFIKLSRKLGWRDRDKKPRIHDFRHSFAIRRLLKWYEEEANLDQKILALSTYLGHVQVTDTYWYLSAVPELLAVVSEKFERFATNERRRNTPCLKTNWK